jgi:catechol 2,3-dioxygenase-like lactoylglutathione lyase family enzyme
MPRFEAIGVVVADLARSAAFYRELGLEFPEPLDPEGHGHVEASLPGGLRLMLDSEESISSFAPEWSPPSGDPRVGLAFRCDSPAEVDEAYARLRSAGAQVQKEPWDADWGQRYAQLKDPDGNAVDLFASLET